MKSVDSGRARPAVLAGAIAPVVLIAALLVAVATDPYPGVTIDSGEYLAVAEGVTEGHGFTMPYLSYDEPYRLLQTGDRVTMTVFPPLYPTLVAGVSALSDSSVLTAARVLGIVVAAAVVLLAQFLVWRDTRRWWAAIGAGLLMLAPDLLTVHAMAWSEGVMILAMLGAIFFVLRYLQRPSRFNLVLAALCASAAGLARFAGIPVIFATGLFLYASEPLRKRVVKTGAFCLLASVPIAAWFVRNGVATGYASEKELGWHPPSGTSLFQLVHTVGGWFLAPGRAARVIGFVLVILAVSVLVARWRTSATERGRGLVPLCFVFGVLYLGFIVAARWLLDQNIPFDARMLAPLQVLLFVGLASSARWDRDAAMRVVSAGIAVVAALSVARGVWTSATFSSLSVMGYTGDQWLESPTLRSAEALPRDTIVITNAPDPLWLWDRRPSLFIPPRSNLYSGEANAHYSSQLEELLSETRCRDAVVVFFHQHNRKPPREIDPLVVYELGLTRTHDFTDGEVYSVDEPACPQQAEPTT